MSRVTAWAITIAVTSTVVAGWLLLWGSTWAVAWILVSAFLVGIAEPAFKVARRG